MANGAIEDFGFKCGWLRGFFDGEGSAVFKTTIGGKTHTTYYLSVTNTDLSLMNTVREYLDELGIGHSEFEIRDRPCRPDGYTRKTLYTLHICRAEDILRFYEFVGFGSVDKQSTLEVMVGWINRPQGFYRMDELVRLRKEGLSFREIAKAMGYAEGSHNRLSELYKREEIKWLEQSVG